MKILGFESENTYSFKSLSLDFTQGLHLVLGENRDSPTADSNQSGKSNIFESLLWTLFGKGTKEVPPDGSGTYTGFRKESVIRNGEKSCKGIVTLSEGDEVYTIERVRGNSPVVTVKRGDLVIGESQDDIDSLIGMSYDTFVQSVFFSQGTKRFTQAKDSEIKKVLDDILGLGIWQEALKSCRERLKKLKADRDEANRSNKSLQVRVETLEHSLGIAKKYYGEKKEAYDSFEKDKALRLQSVLDETKRLVNELEVLGDPPLDFPKDDYDIEQIQKWIYLWRNNAEECRNRMAFAYRRKSEIKPGVCSACEQEVSEEYSQDANEKYEKEYRLAEEKNHEYIVMIQQAELLIGIKSLLDQSEEIGKESMELPSDSDIKDIKQRIKDTKKKIVFDTSLDQEIQDLELLEQAFGNAGVKSLILDNILPILNDRANTYAERLLGAGTELVFDTETKTATGSTRDKFSVRIKTRGGDGYGLCSGGERRRIDFSVALALQSLLPDFGIFVCDEPFESVDETGQRAIVNLLREYADKKSAAVYVITHEPIMQSLFDSELKVIKESGISFLNSI